MNALPTDCGCKTVDDLRDYTDDAIAKSFEQLNKDYAALLQLAKDAGVTI